jgi:hypothetical protein
MSNCCYTGALSKLKLDGHFMDFIEFRPYEVYQKLADGSAESIRGTLDHLDTDIDIEYQVAKFLMTTYVSPNKMQYILPLLGMPVTGTANTYDTTDTLPLFDTKLETPSGTLFTFSDCMVNGYSVRGQKGGGPIRITMDVWAMRMATSDAGVETFSSLVSGLIYAFSRGQFTYDGVEYLYDQFSLDVNHRLIYQHNNSINVTTMCPTDRRIQFQTSTPYNTCSGSIDLFETPWNGDISGAAGNIDFTRDTNETKFSFANMKSVARMPNVNKFNEIRLPLQFMCYKTSSTPAIRVLNVVG